ncbi:MAG: Ig-like domain-containing protein [Gemmatimonadota bacterium]
MKSLTRSGTRLSLGVAVAATVACDAGQGAPAVASVEVNPSAATLLIGATQNFVVSIRDANGNALSGRQVSWSTSAAAIATVTPVGAVTGMA